MTVLWVLDLEIFDVLLMPGYTFKNLYSGTASEQSNGDSTGVRGKTIRGMFVVVQVFYCLFCFHL